MASQLALPNRAHPPIFGPCLLRTNGWMDQHATWYRSRSRPKRHCVRRGSSSPPQKGGRAPSIFGPCLLWPNGCMVQDATWYKVRHRPWPHCVTWGPSSRSHMEHSPQFLAHVCCGQTVAHISYRLPLVTLSNLPPFKFNILWWRHLTAQRKTWTCMQINYKSSPYTQCVHTFLNLDAYRTVQ